MFLLVWLRVCISASCQSASATGGNDISHMSYSSPVRVSYHTLLPHTAVLQYSLFTSSLNVAGASRSWASIVKTGRLLCCCFHRFPFLPHENICNPRRRASILAYHITVIVNVIHCSNRPIKGIDLQ